MRANSNPAGADPTASDWKLMYFAPEPGACPYAFRESAARKASAAANARTVEHVFMCVSLPFGYFVWTFESAALSAPPTFSGVSTAPEVHEEEARRLLEHVRVERRDVDAVRRAAP